jgi:hypothetical protein
MAQDPNDNEWKVLKDQFEELTRRRESQPVADTLEIFDAEIRRRFGEMIFRATIGTSKN